MRKLRHFRIPLESNDGIFARVYVDGHELAGHDDGFRVVNISSSGLGLELPNTIESFDTVDIKLCFKELMLELRAKYIREREYDDAGQKYVGLEYIDHNEVLVQNFIGHIINSLSTKRLRSLMMTMIQNEGNALADDKFEIDLDSTVVVDLFKLFIKYNNSYNLIDLFCQEVKRKIGAEAFNFYLFENECNDIAKFNFADGSTSETLLPVIGYIKQVRDGGKIVKSRISKKSGSDPFYALSDTLYETNTDTFILSPIYDRSGVLIGSLEFVNKKDHELFNDFDLSEIKILSSVLGVIFSVNNEVESFKYPRKLKKIYENGQLVGVSEQTRFLNSFISKLSKSDERVLITGEFGIGKKLVAILIHQSSTHASHNIGHINCHDIDTLETLNNLMYPVSQEAISPLELYSGGTLVFKDINFLSYELQEKLYEMIIDRKDIRFIATSTENEESLESNEDYFKDLFKFFAQKTLRIPSLRERKEDIIPLAHYFSYILCEENNLAPKELTSEIVQVFNNYDWPGNIQELKMALNRLIILGQDMKSIFYKKSSTFPILDRELDNDFLFGLTFNLADNLLVKEKAINKSDFEELYFYFYAEKLLKDGTLAYYDIVEYFEMSEQMFHEKLFYANQKCIEYFDFESPLLKDFLNKNNVA